MQESSKFLYFRQWEDVHRETVNESPLFAPKDLDEGKHCVVGNCNGFPMEERWATETPLFAKVINEKLMAIKAKTVVDFGCGVGRLAKEVLKLNPYVRLSGVDNSKKMLDIAMQHVRSDRFEWVHLCGSDWTKFVPKADFAYAVYVFQHIPFPEVVERIREVSQISDRLLVVNSVCRMAVSQNGFVNDGFNVIEELAKYYPRFSWAIPAESIFKNNLIRKMFMGAPAEGTVQHFAFICERGN